MCRIITQLLHAAVLFQYRKGGIDSSRWDETLSNIVNQNILKQLVHVSPSSGYSSPCKPSQEFINKTQTFT